MQAEETTQRVVNPTSQKRRITAAWVLAGVSAVSVAIPALASCLPAFSNVAPLYVLAAFRQLSLIVAIVLVIALLVTIRVVTRKRGPVLTAVVALVAAVAFLTVGLPRQSLEDPSKVTRSGALRILSWNTNQQDVSVMQLSKLVDETHPNVIVLPEYFTQIAKSSLAQIARSNHMEILGWDASAATLLVSKDLGTYHLDVRHTPPWAGFTAVSDTSDSPKLVIAHLQRPSLLSTSLWAEHLRWIASECSANSVLIGDFNATLQNIGGDRISSCTDAARSLNQSESGTWPTALPSFLGAAIDHVFAGSAWRADSFCVLTGRDTDGSDHRPIFATLRRVVA